ncbi:MAG: hypothetical protein ACRDH7_09340 [Actinomycetota bacterium]
MTDDESGVVLEVKLEGPHAHLGEVPLSDVANLMIGIQDAAAAGAAKVVGKRLTTGRRGKLVENAARIRLVRLMEASVGVLVRPPSLEEEASDLDETTEALTTDTGVQIDHGQSLGYRALSEVTKAVRSRKPDPAIARALLQMSKNVGVGVRHDAIAFIEDPDTPNQRVTRIDASNRDRLRGYLSSSAVEEADEVISGVVFEADFEANTARLRDPTNQAVDFEFPEELAERVKEALRERAELDAHVTLDPETQTARRVEVRQVFRGRQMELEQISESFRRSADVMTLVTEQGIQPIEDPSSLKLDLDDDETDGFLEALGLEA